MSSLTRNQEFKYQYKNVAIANAYFCGFGPLISVAVPDTLLDIKAIFMHAAVRFNPSVPSSHQKIHQIVVGNAVIDVDLPAQQPTRVADLKIDITHLKDSLLEKLAEGTMTNEQPRIDMRVVTNTQSELNIDGEIILWKVDFAYTTTGIQ